MEPTYHWDALSAEARHWLDVNTPPGRTFHFHTYPHSWFYMRKTGELAHKLYPADPGIPVWYVVQNRPGHFTDTQRRLIAESPPAYTVTKLGVPLIWVFPSSEYVRVTAGEK
jgi:hypothetical protein